MPRACRADAAARALVSVRSGAESGERRQCIWRGRCQSEAQLRVCALFLRRLGCIGRRYAVELGVFEFELLGTRLVNLLDAPAAPTAREGPVQSMRYCTTHPAPLRPPSIRQYSASSFLRSPWDRSALLWTTVPLVQQQPERVEWAGACALTACSSRLGRRGPCPICSNRSH